MTVPGRVGGSRLERFPQRRLGLHGAMARGAMEAGCVPDLTGAPHWRARVPSSASLEGGSLARAGPRRRSRSPRSARAAAGFGRSTPSRSTEEGADLRQLITLLHRELHRLAEYQMRKQPPGHVLQTTALLDEACLRLLGAEQRRWRSRQHFLAAAARTMRHVLVDHARRRQRKKRCATRKWCELDDLPQRSGSGIEADLIDLDDALRSLAEQRPDHGRIVEYRVFGGLSLREIGELEGVDEHTVLRRWKLAIAWLSRALSGR